MDQHLDPRLRPETSTSANRIAASFPIPNGTTLPLPTSTATARPSLPPLTDAYPPARPLPSPPSARRPSEISPVEENGQETKRSRACEPCRGLKVRCDFKDDAAVCRRCAKANRPCIVTAPTRKRQRKTDSKVAELERKIDALTASLQANRPDAVYRNGRRHAEHEHAEPDAHDDHDSSQHSSRSGHVEDLRAPAAAEPDASSWNPHPEILLRATPSFPHHPPLHTAQSAPLLPLPVTRPSLPPPSLPRESSTASTAFSLHSLKRKHSDGSSSARAASPDLRRAAPLRKPSTELTSPSKDQPPNLYPFLIPKPPPGHANGIPSNMPSDASRASESADGPRYEYADVIDRRRLSAEDATAIFDRFVTVLSPHHPIIVFPPATTAAEIRKTKPTLFLAILSVASGAFDPAIQKFLNKEITRVLADRIIGNGEKSLELIQALHVVTVWYWPPEHYEELKFYQLTHIAAIMALDLNLGKKVKNPRAKQSALGYWRDHPWRRTPLPDPEAAESRRAWLTCYILCATTSMSLRRPNLIRWTPYMGECVEVLESGDAVPSDRLLCQWVRLQRIAEEVGVQLAMDDPCATVRLSDWKVQCLVKEFECQLEDWRAQLPPDLDGRKVQLHAHVVNLYMHEVAMHMDHNVEEFRPPYHEEQAKGPPEPLTPTHLEGLTTCLAAIQGIITIFLSYDPDTIRILPITQFVRVAYAVVCLTKLYFTATVPNSELGKFIGRDDLKVEQNLDGLLESFRIAAEGDRCRPAAKFLMVLVMLKTWFQKQRAAATAGGTPSSKDRLAAAAGPQPSDGCDDTACLLRRSFVDALRHERSRTQTPRARPASAPGHEPEVNNHRVAAALLSHGSVNTPLELLSEVAMGDSRGGVGASCGNLSGTIATSTATAVSTMSPISRLAPPPAPTPASPAAALAIPDWYGVTTTGTPTPTPPPPPPAMTHYAHHHPESHASLGGSVGGGGVYPAAAEPSDSDANLGDGFGQAMSMTLSGEDFPSMLLDDMFFSQLMDGSQNFPDNWGGI
ncbi:MAG: hypothetical protein M1826_004368 [Phylliscum demangeonii]|nr:MAG: hypothetical protein M1826_004368 [Phylliscum demangeonii]